MDRFVKFTAFVIVCCMVMIVMALSFGGPYQEEIIKGAGIAALAMLAMCGGTMALRILVDYED